ncbi:MAG TPA: hypothetical protein VJX67_25140 [Blastocatellia bacterium]|nr:hypothetical protein [Blastocatellia bacterium]
MQTKAGGEEPIPEYRVRACNTSASSENRIHDDAVALEYGFRGGLVPGITVYAYMTVPVVERFGLDWLERGSMAVRFLQPFYQGDEVIVRAGPSDSSPSGIGVTAGREDGAVCAIATASVTAISGAGNRPSPEDYPLRPLPGSAHRLPASRAALTKGTVLGTLVEKLNLIQARKTILAAIEERLPVYYGPNPVAHPWVFLALANRALMENVTLGPWIHTASELTNWGVVRDGEEVSIRGKINDCFERKGHEFVVLDLLLSAGGRVVQQVRHTAIFNPRKP